MAQRQSDAERNPDASSRAAADLSDAIENPEFDDGVVILSDELREKHEAIKAAQGVAEKRRRDEQVSVELAMQAKPVIAHESHRDKMRLLIFTKNIDVAREQSVAQRHLLELAELFAEVHVVVLCRKNALLMERKRLTPSLWLYPTASTSTWRIAFDAYRLAKDQLVFGQGFRADVVIAEDPFESGAVGYMLARKYHRSLQVEVTEDFSDIAWLEADTINRFRALLAHFVVTHADCVRAKTETLKNMLSLEFPKILNRIEILPTYFNLTAWRDAAAEFALKERYPQCNFFFLHVTLMREHSYTTRVLHALSDTLRNHRTIGLVIVGDGPNRERIRKEVVLLGIQSQVFFESMPEDLVSHMKSADLLVHLSREPEEDPILIQAAVSKLPILGGLTGLAGELFEDGKTAFLCPNDDIECMASKVREFLNKNHLRSQLAVNAQEAVFERVEQNYAAYLTTYHDSIVRCALPENEAGDDSNREGTVVGS